MSKAARNHWDTDLAAAAQATVSCDERVDDITQYVNLINDHLTGNVDARAFALAYLEMFKADERTFAPGIFDVLNALFADADCYVDDPKMRDSIADLDSDQLRKRAEFAAAKLVERSE